MIFLTCAGSRWLACTTYEPQLIVYRWVINNLISMIWQECFQYICMKAMLWISQLLRRKHWHSHLSMGYQTTGVQIFTSAAYTKSTHHLQCKWATFNAQSISIDTDKPFFISRSMAVPCSLLLPTLLHSPPLARLLHNTEPEVPKEQWSKLRVVMKQVLVEPLPTFTGN